jgi:transcription antitermination factor NusG
MTDVIAAPDLREGWFVVWTESRAEKKVESRLAEIGLEPWLPKVKERRRWSDRWREVVTPLFPGYLFARGGAAQLSRLLRTPGVLTVVKHGARPVLLASDFITSLRRAVENPGVGVERVDDPVDYRQGDEVIVREGPLAGVRGVVQEMRSSRRLVVWVEHIGRGVAFTIGSALVSRASR